MPIYWQVKTKDKFVSLDELRKLYEMVCVEQASDARPSGAVSYSIRLYKLAQIEGFLSENELEKFKYLITEEYQDLNERGRRLYAAQQVLDFGWGGQRYVASFLGISRDTIRRGLKEIGQSDLLEKLPPEKQRKK